MKTHIAKISHILGYMDFRLKEIENDRTEAEQKFTERKEKWYFWFVDWFFDLSKDHQWLIIDINDAYKCLEMNKVKIIYYRKCMSESTGTQVTHLDPRDFGLNMPRFYKYIKIYHL